LEKVVQELLEQLQPPQLEVGLLVQFGQLVDYRAPVQVQLLKVEQELVVVLVGRQVHYLE
jgi:hypothetical protein